MTSDFTYGVYGFALKSDFPLPLPSCAPPQLGEIVVRRARAGDFDAQIAGLSLTRRDDWYEHGRLDDGSSFVRWRGLGEYLVGADGGRIACAKAPEASEESFGVYLLGQALSFALVKAGFEPLHATVVVRRGQAVGLLGDSGHGKSTLAASFLADGGQLLTDDLLLLRPESGRMVGYPGPPRIKLLPDAAAWFPNGAAGGAPMNAVSHKQVIPLAPGRGCGGPAALAALYVLAPPDEMRRCRKIRITPLTPREAFLALVANTFNRYVTDPPRLARLHAAASEVVRTLPVRKIVYPRGAERLAEVRAAILADCAAARAPA